MSNKSNKSSNDSLLMGILLLALTRSNPINFSRQVNQSSSKSNKNNKDNKNQNTITNSITKNDADKIIENKNSFIDKDFSVIWKILKTPYSSTYYLNKTPNNQISRNFYSESIYPIKDIDESSALYVFTKNDKIVDINIDEFSGTPSGTWQNSDYVVNSYAYHLGSDIDLKDLPIIDNNIDLNKIKNEYVNKSLSTFKNNFNLSYGSHEALDKQRNLQLSVFPIINATNASPQTSFYIVSEKDIIKDIKIDRPYLNFERLIEYFICK